MTEAINDLVRRMYEEAWKGESDLKKHPDQPVLIRFRLRASKLFVFEIA